MEKLQKAYKPPPASRVREKNMEKFENITLRKNGFIDVNLKAKRVDTNINIAKMKKIAEFRYGIGNRENGKVYRYIVYKLGDRIIIERNVAKREQGIFIREARDFFEVVFD
jgi:hypothetical protein